MKRPKFSIKADIFEKAMKDNRFFSLPENIWLVIKGEVKLYDLDIYVPKGAVLTAKETYISKLINKGGIVNLKKAFKVETDFQQNIFSRLMGIFYNIGKKRNITYIDETLYLLARGESKPNVKIVEEFYGRDSSCAKIGNLLDKGVQILKTMKDTWHYGKERKYILIIILGIYVHMKMPIII